jgi:uncharacterized protein
MLEKTINNYFAGHNEVAAVFIYGSHAGGQPRTDSDVDVAILMTTYDPDSEHAARALYMAELSRLTRKVIHPVIINSAGETLLKQILGKGRCIQVNDPKSLSRFKMTAIARIADYGYYQRFLQQGVIRQIMGGEDHG